MHRRHAIFAIILLLLATPAANCQDAVKVGDRIGKLEFTDIRSLPRTLDDLGAKKAFVLVFTNASCPLAERYLPTLKALEKEYRAKEVQFVAVNAAEEDSIVAMATQSVRHEVEFPFVKDFGGLCARTLGVRRTPEAVVLDGEKRLRYRGRIDDQYRLTGVRKEPTSRDLQAALDAVLSGRKVVNPETEVDGCPITFPKKRKPREVTYAEEVAPLLQKNCCQCHRAGGSAPFSLTSYKSASARGEMLAEVITQERMPPWFASDEFGPFVNRRGLSDEERATVIDWVRVGTPPGDIKKRLLHPKSPRASRSPRANGLSAPRPGLAVGRVGVAGAGGHPLPICDSPPCFPSRYLDPGRANPAGQSTRSASRQYGIRQSLRGIQ